MEATPERESHLLRRTDGHLLSLSLPSEHEGSRRMKTELLVQLDGLAKTDDLVFLLAASNLPWFDALVRRSIQSLGKALFIV